MYVARIQLPSKGKYGVSHVKVKRPTIGDLRDYLSFKGSSVLIKNELVKKLCDTDLSEHPVGDREFVFVNVRGMVSAPVIADSFTCKHCEAGVDYRLDTRKVPVAELPVSFVKDYELEFPVCKTKKIVNILTVEKEQLLQDFMQVYEEAGEESSLQHIELGKDLYTFAEKARIQ